MHLQITRKLGLYTHDAIYMGYNRVVHIFMSEGGSLESAQARDDPWSKFIGDVNSSGLETVSVVVYRLKIRTVDEIITEAENLVEKQFGKGQYDLAKENCQHFASFCCTGQKMSIGVHNAIDTYLESMLVLHSKLASDLITPSTDFLKAAITPLDRDKDI